MKKNNKKQKLYKEVQKTQERILTTYNRRMKNKERKQLAEFLKNNSRLGGKEFQNLSSTCKDALVEMNLKSLHILKKGTRNPFMKIRFSIALFMAKGLRSAA